MMYDTTLLHSFVVIAEQGGLTRAAERLNLTQSAVSARLRQLEEQVGHRLFRRTTRKVGLTQQGEKLLAYARSILALHADAQASLARAPYLDGHVRLGVCEDFPRQELVQLLGRFGQSHPAVPLQLKFGLSPGLIGDAEEGLVDLVLGSRCTSDEGGEVLWTEPLVWAFAEPRPAPITHNNPLPLAFFPEPCPYRAAAIAALAAAGLRWRIACESASATGIRVAVLAGLGITPIPEGALSPGLRSIGQEAALPELPPAQFILFASSRRRLVSVAHELAQAIRLHFTMALRSER
jgi:DNA-binding transcriptional LysR family regulator